MVRASNIPWMQINHFLLHLEKTYETEHFCSKILDELNVLISFDQVRVYFLDQNYKLYDTFLLGVDEQWINRYLEYYSKLEDGKFSLMERTAQEDEKKLSTHIRTYDWTSLEPNEFITDYIMPQGLKHSLGFILHEVENYSYIIFTLDRTRPVKYSDKEVSIVQIIRPHLENLYRNLMIFEKKAIEKGSSHGNHHGLMQELTNREREITDLICRGMTPKNISKRLSISIATTYRHMANIYAKTHVSSRHELMMKFGSIGM